MDERIQSAGFQSLNRQMHCRRLPGLKNGLKASAIVSMLLLVAGACTSSSDPTLAPVETVPSSAPQRASKSAPLEAALDDVSSSGPVAPGQWATVFPFQVRTTSYQAVELVSVVPLRERGVEIGGLFVTGPHIPSLSLGVFKGWPPEPWLGDQGDVGAIPTPKVSDFHPVKGFIVKAKPKGQQERTAWGEHRLYSDLVNEATIVMKYRLKPGSETGGVRGFAITYRLPGGRLHRLKVPNSGVGLCLEEVSHTDPDRCNTSLIPQGSGNGGR